MSKVLESAARAFERLQHDEQVAMAPFLAADRAFDGDEFSSPHQWRAEQRRYTARIEYVSARFRVSPHELRNRLYARPYIEQDRFIDACRARRTPAVRA